MCTLEIRNGEVDKAIEIMREVAEWGRNKGLRVWLENWLTADQLITDEARPENFYVGSINGEDVCSFILQWQDNEWWENSPRYEAAYLHKLCVRRTYAHMKMTCKVIECIKEECKKYDVNCIRLDTANDEEVVKQIYLNLGFKIVKLIKLDNEKAMALYELKFKDK